MIKVSEFHGNVSVKDTESDISLTNGSSIKDSIERMAKSKHINPMDIASSIIMELINCIEDPCEVYHY